MMMEGAYQIAPELSVIGLGALVILVDLVVGRKRVLTFLTLIGLIVPLGLTFLAWGNGSETGGGLFGTIAVDQFSLFFRVLIVGILALVVMGSVDYVSQMRQFQGEYYGLLLFSGAGMMLLASATE